MCVWYLLSTKKFILWIIVMISMIWLCKRSCTCMIVGSSGFIVLYYFNVSGYYHYNHCETILNVISCHGWKSVLNSDHVHITTRYAYSYYYCNTSIIIYMARSLNRLWQLLIVQNNHSHSGVWYGYGRDISIRCSLYNVIGLIFNNDL